MISLNIRPSDSTPEAVFGDTTTMRTEHYPKGFVLVKDLAGETYWPSMGINGLGMLHTGEGYQMYSDSTDTVRAVGSAINAYATPISLNKGWNLPAYLPQINLPIETTLSGIVSQIMMMKDNDGEIYFPDYEIDEIDTMVVGQSYFMYMKSVATLEYAGSPKEVSSNAHQLLSLPTRAITGSMPIPGIMPRFWPPGCYSVTRLLRTVAKSAPLMEAGIWSVRAR